MRDDDTDWDAAELDYRAGVLPFTAIAVKHGITVAKLKSKAQKFGWERRALDPLAIKQAHGIASSPSPARFGMDSILSPPDLEQMAILSAATVLDIHRKDVAKLRGLSTKFTDALAEVFNILADPANLADDATALSAVMRKLGAINGDATPADLLEKLSRVMVRLVAIERQAFGLDVMPNPDPGAEATDQKVQSQVNALWAQITQIQKEKTDMTKH